MTTQANAVSDLIQGWNTHRLQTDPGDELLFTPRTRSPRRRAARAVDWTIPKEEPVKQVQAPPAAMPKAPAAPRRWPWVVFISAMGLVGYVAAVSTDWFVREPARPAVAAVQPAMLPVPLPWLVPVPVDEPVVAPASAPQAVEAAPTVAAAPTVVAVQPVEAPAPATAVAHHAKRAHATKHSAKRAARKHANAAAPAVEQLSEPASAPAAPARHHAPQAQVDDSESPLSSAAMTRR